MKIHVMNIDTGETYCGGGIIGDKAISLAAARDMTNNMYFDCEDCYKVLAPDEHNGAIGKE